MHFADTFERAAIQAVARRFAKERLRPAFRAREQAGRIDVELAREMGALGLIPRRFPRYSAVSLAARSRETAYGRGGHVQMVGIRGRFRRYVPMPDAAWACTSSPVASPVSTAPLARNGGHSAATSAFYT